MVPGAGAVVVGVQEEVDVPEVLVDGEQRVAWSFEGRGVVGEALLQVVDVVLQLVEEVVARLAGPVLAGAVGAEGVEEVLQDAQGGGGGLVRLQVVVEQGGREEGPLLEIAGQCRSWSHVLQMLECIPRIVDPQVVAREAGGQSHDEEQQCQGAVPPAGL